VAGPYLQLRDLAPKLGVGGRKAHVVGLLVVVGGALHAPRPDNLQMMEGDSLEGPRVMTQAGGVAWPHLHLTFLK
jgi:hypothetical protein